MTHRSEPARLDPIRVTQNKLFFVGIGTIVTDENSAAKRKALDFEKQDGQN